jgi:hypothetical protein
MVQNIHGEKVGCAALIDVSEVRVAVSGAVRREAVDRVYDKGQAAAEHRDPEHAARERGTLLVVDAAA